ncbi:MAG TPA: hypothetical protein VFS21_14800 [Roseiflexaceae bacterium]|nr:hypothetical protein [Roseiflexaceae bacterium]
MSEQTPDMIGAAALRLARSAQETSFNHLFAPASIEDLEAIRKYLSLSAEMVEWYRTMAPLDVEIPVIGNRPILYAPHELKAIQREYAFDVSTGERDPQWGATWIVIGGEGEYPVIVQSLDTGDRGVYYCEVKKRRWQSCLLSTDLEGFLLGLSDYIDLYTQRYNHCICDDDSVLLPAFAADFSALLDLRPSTYGLGDAWLHGWLGM